MIYSRDTPFWSETLEMWHDDGYNCTLHFDPIVNDLDLDSKSQECEKAQTSVSIIPQTF